MSQVLLQNVANTILTSMQLQIVKKKKNQRVHPKLRCVWRRRKSIHAKLYLYYWLLGKAANNSEEETEEANPAGHSPPPSAHCRLGWLLWGTRCLDSLPGRYASSESHTATPAHTAQQSTLYRCYLWGARCLGSLPGRYTLSVLHLLHPTT